MAKSKPPLKKVPLKKVNLDKLNDFASGATPPESVETSKKATAPKKRSKKSPPSPTPIYPWEDPMVRPDIKKGVNLQLPEPMLLKLRYLSQETGVSQQRFLRDVISPAIEKKLKDLIG